MSEIRRQAYNDVLPAFHIQFVLDMNPYHSACALKFGDCHLFISLQSGHPRSIFDLHCMHTNWILCQVPTRRYPDNRKYGWHEITGRQTCTWAARDCFTRSMKNLTDQIQYMRKKDRHPTSAIIEAKHKRSMHVCTKTGKPNTQTQTHSGVEIMSPWRMSISCISFPHMPLLSDPVSCYNQYQIKEMTNELHGI